jgi:hypothetical protein
MPASTPTGDRRSVPTVAIIGNDAVLVAAPATPVQLSHACLRRGFTMAVPASWGDELVATEVLRQLASKGKGPAVMCVCPHARSRLLTPGPDLEPFLVSLAAPPVATARYLRSAYGGDGVNITYIGSCPSADDPVIDERLTPTAFLADLADRGIALSEQPLVFDSIVPPDRRRWCSLPGGVPSPETLGADPDARSLVEIERDDVSTDLVQHIMMREHVLLDLAPSLGCACSGAIGAVAPRSARPAVCALEPPRALGPVIDSTVIVSLGVTLQAPPVARMANQSASPVEADSDLLERRMDEMLGVEVHEPRIERELEAEFAAELDADLAELTAARRSTKEPRSESSSSPGGVTRAHVSVAAKESGPTSNPATRALETSTRVRANVADVADVPADIHVTGVVDDMRVDETITGQVNPPPYSVRRRTPPAMPARYTGGGVPKATGTDGRPLPRAYVAWRRTPAGGIVPIEESARRIDDDEHVGEAPRGDTPAESTLPIGNSAMPATLSESAPPEPSMAVAAPVSSATEPTDAGRSEPSAHPEVGVGGAVTAPASNQGPLRMLMFAVLLVIAVVALYTLRP